MCVCLFFFNRYGVHLVTHVLTHSLPPLLSSDLAVLPLRTLPPRFNRYQGGGTYGLHVDGSVMHVAAPGQPTATMRTDISCTLFLCEPDEYDGGELVIHDTYGEHEVKLPAGDLVIYPSSSLHRELGRASCRDRVVRYV